MAYTYKMLLKSYLPRSQRNINKHFVKERQKKKNKMAYTYKMPLEIPPKEEARCLQKRE